MKKVLFLIRSYDIASSRVRVTLLLEKLSAKGYDITTEIYPKSLGDKLRLFKSLKQYDIVIIQKKMPSIPDAFLFKTFARKLLFDFDDAIQLKHENMEKKRSRSAEIKYINILKKCDLVIVGNPVLEREAREYNPNVEIVPSVVETDGMPVRDYDKKNEKFVVGWVGTKFNLTQLAMLGEVFRRLSAEIPLEVRVISSGCPEFEGVDVRFIPWTLEGQDEEIARFDAGVMPLPDSPHARGKCGYKAIQYMACGVVPVVSDVGSNRDIVPDGEVGFVAAEIDDFYEKLKFIYENPNRARVMGGNAAKHAKEHFSVDAAVDMLDRIFSRL